MRKAFILVLILNLFPSAHAMDSDKPLHYVALTPADTGNKRFDYFRETRSLQISDNWGPEIVFFAWLGFNVYVLFKAYVDGPKFIMNAEDILSQHENEMKDLGDQNLENSRDGKLSAEFLKKVSNVETNVKNSKADLLLAKRNKFSPLKQMVIYLGGANFISYGLFPTHSNSKKLFKKWFHPVLNKVKSRANRACRAEGASQATHFERIVLKSVILGEASSPSEASISEPTSLSLATYDLDGLDLSTDPDLHPGIYYVFDPETITCVTQQGKSVRLSQIRSQVQ